jgi:uncharacterized membrane protein YphA (DoxX/SURF4 family)
MNFETGQKTAAVLGRSCIALLVFQSVLHNMKNLAITGALLHLFAMGSGPFSLKGDGVRQEETPA